MKTPVGVAGNVEQQREKLPVAGLWTARDRISLSGLLTGLIPFAVAFAVYLLVFVEMRPLGATGDEPHYLIAAESIAYDLDFDLTNDYASRERVLRVVNVFPLGPHAAVYKDSGELRPYRGVGLPALLALGVGLGGLTGARLVMVLIAALFADQLYRLLRDLRFRRLYRNLAWVSVVFCMPVLVFTSQIYPELPGALLVLVALRVMVAGGSSAGGAGAGVDRCGRPRVAPRAVSLALRRHPGRAGHRCLSARLERRSRRRAPRCRQAGACRCAALLCGPHEALAHRHAADPRSVRHRSRIALRALSALVWEPRSPEALRGRLEAPRLDREAGTSGTSSPSGTSSTQRSAGSPSCRCTGSASRFWGASSFSSAGLRRPSS